ncbi:MAG: DUF59 domain-containing protein [Bacteroidales bacterium]|nr:DUF59 domain-containing protein [Bacteroidales bacterium]
MKNKEAIKEAVINRLKTIYDPEIPVNIWDMGLVYDVRVDDGDNVDITMTVTAPNCPVAETLPAEVKSEIESNVPEVNKAEVHITFDPPWDMSMLTEEAKDLLGFDFL